MLYDILHYAGLEPGIISGAGLVSLIKKGKIGNAAAGNGEWLVIEADESDGSIVNYEPEIGLLVNVGKDHKESGALMEIFKTFKKNSDKFIVNRSHPLAKQLSQEAENDFAIEMYSAGYCATAFKKEGLSIHYNVK